MSMEIQSGINDLTALIEQAQEAERQQQLTQRKAKTATGVRKIEVNNQQTQKLEQALDVLSGRVRELKSQLTRLIQASKDLEQKRTLVN